MKKVKIAFFVAVVVFVNVRSTEEKTSNAELATSGVADTARITALLEKYEASRRPRKYIYLTIDDAPLNGSQYIDSIISIEKIKTSLFVVGSPVFGSKRFQKYYEALQENPYIEIYNHSFSHANNRYLEFYKNPDLAFADFEKNQAELNITHKIARLPGRDLWMVGERKKNCRQTGTTSAELLAKNGYEVFGWDVEWKFNPTDLIPCQSVDELITEIEDLNKTSMVFTSNHVVLLIHNQMFGKINDKNNLQELIEKLRENGFTFEYLSSYSGLTHPSTKLD